MSEGPRQNEERGGNRQQPRRPYDSSEIEKLPHPNESDPPYKPWWLDQTDEPPQR